jgi:hypothetical protein
MFDTRHLSTALHCATIVAWLRGLSVSVWAAIGATTLRKRQKTKLVQCSWSAQHCQCSEEIIRKTLRSQERKFGVDKKVAEGRWNEQEASCVQRDWEGRGGCLRLWLQKSTFKDDVVSTYIDNASTEGSERKKNVTNAQRDTLRMHAFEAAGSVGHEFFYKRSSLEVREALVRFHVFFSRVNHVTSHRHS